MNRFVIYLLLCVSLVFFVACGKNHNSSHNTGSVSFTIELKGVPGTNAKSLLAPAVDICAAPASVATVEAAIYDGNNGTLLTSGSWACSAHSGILSGIPVGTNRKLVVNTRDASGIIKYSGAITGVSITGGVQTDAGAVTLTPFIMWSINTIDTAGNTGLYSSIAHDSNNKIHIAYYNSTGKTLKYITTAGTTTGTWLDSFLDATGDVGQFVSLALDSTNKKYLSYYDATNKVLKFATNSSGTWTTTTVDNMPDVGQYSHIAVNPAGTKIHISYYDYTHKHLKYAAGTNSAGVVSWTTATVDTSSSDTGQYSSVAVDSSGYVHISYYDNTQGYLMYADNVSGSWNTNPLDSTASVGQYSSIAVDSNGKVHICYYDSTGNLKYATNVSGTWNNSTVVDSAYNTYINYSTRYYQFGTYTSIAIDSNNAIHIAYHQASYQYSSTPYNYTYKLKYATNSSGAWITYAVDDINTSYNYYANDTGWDSITVDSNGKVHISYYDSTNGYLKYATSAQSSWSTGILDMRGNVGQYSAVSADSSGKTYISYYDATNGILKYATDSSGAWTANTVNNVPNVGQYSSSTLNTNKNANISFYDATNKVLKYATNSAGSWATTTVDSSADVGKYSSMTTDSLGKIYVSYYDATNGDLKYATNAAGVWTTSIVGDGLGDYGYYTSIAVDSNKKAYISYADAYGKLKFVTNSSGTWAISTIDTGTTTNANQYQYTSLRLDSSNNAYLCYYDSTNHDLKYAAGTNSGGVISWATVTIDSVGDVGSYCSLALDSNKKVHISYYDATSGGLKYATNASGSWLLYKLDSGAGVGQYTSIAVDGSNRLHISYYDSTNQDLRYTTNTVTGAAGGTLSDQSPPAAPTGVSAAPGSTSQINVSWAAATDNIGVAGYKIYRNNSYYSTVSGATTTIFPDSGLTPYTQYCYAVSAVDTSGNESMSSNSVCATTYLLNASPISNTYIYQYAFDIDTLGNPYVAYSIYNSLNSEYETIYTTNILGSWVTTTVGSNTSYNDQSLGIAVDASGHSNIIHAAYSYVNSSYIQTLWYTSNAPGSWSTPAAIDTSIYSGLNGAIVTDISGDSHVVYYQINQAGAGVMKYAYAVNSPFSMSTSTLVSAVNNPYETIAVDSANNLHTAYTSTTGALIYATKSIGPSSWSTYTIDIPSGGSYPSISNASIAVDGANTVHLCYINYYYDAAAYNYVYQLKYATLTVGGAWSAPITVDAGASNSTAYIAVDPSTYATYISYYNGNGSTLATNASGTWQTYKIVNGGGPVKVDANHIIHMVYPNNVSGGLNYLTGHI